MLNTTYCFFRGLCYKKEGYEDFSNNPTNETDVLTANLQAEAQAYLDASQENRRLEVANNVSLIGKALNSETLKKIIELVLAINIIKSVFGEVPEYIANGGGLLVAIMNYRQEKLKSDLEKVGDDVEAMADAQEETARLVQADLNRYAPSADDVDGKLSSLFNGMKISD